nr:hypothetical protein [Tanacetum cinerariifolium]
IKCGKEYLRGSRLVLLWRNGWWRWWWWGQLSLFGICEHGAEIVYGIGLVCHGVGLCGDVSEEGGGQLDEGLDIGGGGSVFESGVFFRRHANDRVSWDNYPWVSYVWPTLNKHLRDVNVKRWQPLYANDPTNETDTKSYSIEGFAWPFKGQLPVERLVPDETEARSRWWVSSRAYFDERSFEDEQIPRHLNQNNYFEVPSKMYQEFEEQRRGYQQMKEKDDDICPHGVLSAFHTLANNSSFFNMAMPSNWQTPNQSNWLSPSNWQTPNPSYLGTPNSQPPIPSQPDDVTITGVQQTDNYFNYETVDPDKVTRDVYVLMTKFLLDPYDIYLDCHMKGYKLPSFFWPQLVPHMCTYRRERSWPEGWLSSDHMDSWIQILIRERTENDNCTLAKSGTVCLHQENNRFMILTDPHNIRTLDGSVCRFQSWNDATWLYMPINVGEVHWVTGAINLADSIFYVFDSMESDSRMLMLEQQVNN